MNARSYSYLTLLPHDHDERRLLWKYKLDGIRKTMFFCAIASTSVVIFTLTLFIVKRNRDEFVYFLITLLAVCLFGMIYCLSKISDSFVYLIPIFRLIIHGLYIYSTRNLVLNENECSYSTLFILFLDEAYFNLCFLFETVFLSPSMKVTILTYTPLYIGAHTVQVLIRFQSSDIQ